MTKRYSEPGKWTVPSLDPALEVPCPECDAPAGEKCIDGKGRPVHQARRSASYRARYPAVQEDPVQ
jgi:hypothetical protein